jgi:hypothetical protein
VRSSHSGDPAPGLLCPGGDCLLCVKFARGASSAGTAAYPSTASVPVGCRLRKERARRRHAAPPPDQPATGFLSEATHTLISHFGVRFGTWRSPRTCPRDGDVK